MRHGVHGLQKPAERCRAMRYGRLARNSKIPRRLRCLFDLGAHTLCVLFASVNLAASVPIDPEAVSLSAIERAFLFLRRVLMPPGRPFPVLFSFTVFALFALMFTIVAPRGPDPVLAPFMVLAFLFFMPAYGPPHSPSPMDLAHSIIGFFLLLNIVSCSLIVGEPGRGNCANMTCAWLISYYRGRYLPSEPVPRRCSGRRGRGLWIS